MQIKSVLVQQVAPRPPVASSSSSFSSILSSQLQRQPADGHDIKKHKESERLLHQARIELEPKFALKYNTSDP